MLSRNKKIPSTFIFVAKAIFAAALIITVIHSASYAASSDLPLAAGSPLAGFAFDDRPLLLPVQRNFQMAMLTASAELGRSCGKMEAYGWRMDQSEQIRVNQIFNNTVDRLRALGFAVEAQAPNSVSRDVTLFTADRPDRHFIFMWSAGEIGLVMVLCESSSSMSGRTATGVLPSPAMAERQDVLASRLDTPVSTRTRKSVSNFSPLGDWVGSYTCAQGLTGGTLQITKLKGENFEGIFRFYPTPKNPYVASGRYIVYGQYDQDSLRILINPGKWLQRPPNYYNTIMIGSFDPIGRTFSAYFQGITGCTSFEAKYMVADNYEDVKKAPMKHHAKKKKAAKKTAASISKSSSDQKTETAPEPTPSLQEPAAAPQIISPAPAPETTSTPAPAAAVVSPVVSPTTSPAATPAVAPPSLVSPAAPVASKPQSSVPPPPAAAPVGAPSAASQQPSSMAPASAPASAPMSGSSSDTGAPVSAMPQAAPLVAPSHTTQ